MSLAPLIGPFNTTQRSARPLGKSPAKPLHLPSKPLSLAMIHLGWPSCVTLHGFDTRIVTLGVRQPSFISLFVIGIRLR